MDFDDLKLIDTLAALLERPIPNDYLELLRNYPSALRHCSRGDESHPASGYVSQVELLSHVAAVLELNQEARQAPPILDPENVDFHWPPGLLVIGETGFGDYYCIDTTGEFPGVLQFEHQPCEFYEVADSLSEFTDMLLETFAVN